MQLSLTELSSAQLTQAELSTAQPSSPPEGMLNDWSASSSIELTDRVSDVTGWWTG